VAEMEIYGQGSMEGQTVIQVYMNIWNWL